MEWLGSFGFFYISKLVEFLDTGFMILRKKNDQISFLHVYHHIMTYGLWWIGAKYVPGGDAFFSAMLNSWVHLIMYLYYLMSSLGIRDVWWKKYLTQIQMIQFVVNIIHALYGIIIDVDCPFPKWMGWSHLFYMVSLLILFGNFYIKAYNERKKAKEAKKFRNLLISSAFHSISRVSSNNSKDFISKSIVITKTDSTNGSKVLKNLRSL